MKLSPICLTLLIVVAASGRQPALDLNDHEETPSQEAVPLIFPWSQPRVEGGNGSSQSPLIVSGVRSLAALEGTLYDWLQVSRTNSYFLLDRGMPYMVDGVLSYCFEFGLDRDSEPSKRVYTRVLGTNHLSNSFYVFLLEDGRTITGEHFPSLDPNQLSGEYEGRSGICVLQVERFGGFDLMKLDVFPEGDLGKIGGYVTRFNVLDGIPAVESELWEWSGTGAGGTKLIRAGNGASGRQGPRKEKESGSSIKGGCQETKNPSVPQNGE